MKKIFIITESSHPPTVDETKKIVEMLCTKASECNTYAGSTLALPDFIIKNYDNDSSIVMIEDNKYIVFKNENLQIAIEELKSNP